MTDNPSEQKLSKLEQKKQQLEEQIKTIKARQKQQARKDDTRRKILIGAAMLKEAKSNKEFARILSTLLDKNIEKEKDRRLAGFLSEHT